jgi:hypothetical protein
MATFQVPGALGVAFAFQDADHFSLTPTVGSATTLVVARRIYLHVPPSLANAGRGQLLWVGDLARIPARDGPRPALPLHATRLTPAERAGWQFASPVHDVDTVLAGQPVRLTVVRDERLATAQWLVDRTLRAAMEMSLCGDGISRLLETWDPRLTGPGHAVVAASGGIRLQAAPAALPARIALPQDLRVEDYRVARRA